MKALTRDAILKATDLVKEVVEVPEWGGSVTIQSLNAERREQWEPFFVDDESNNTRAALLAFSIVDDDDQLMFTVDDIAELNKKSYAGMKRVYEAAMKLNSMGSVEEAEKNSESDPTSS